MLSVHQIALDPNNKQRTFFAKSAGTARFSYNWALARWKELYTAGNKPSEVSLRRELNAIKKEKYPWMLEVGKCAPQQAVKNLGTAFNRFFKKQGGYPKFKKKGEHDSFRCDNGPAKKGADAVQIKGRKIKIPRLGWVRMREHLRFQGQIHELHLKNHKSANLLQVRYKMRRRKVTDHTLPTHYQAPPT